jgi:two-component system, NtrC family, sensor kinase
METITALLSPLAQLKESNIYIFFSMVVMLLVILLLHKTYRASMNVAAKLAEFSSLTGNTFGGRMKLIETSADEFHLNRQALGPLARIIDEYCVSTTDHEGMITYCNSKFLSLTGYTQAKLVGSTPTFSNGAGETSSDWTSTRRKLSPDKVWHGELVLKTATGEFRCLDCFVFPLDFITSGEQGYIYFGTDITELKRHNNKLINEVKKRDETINKMEGMLFNSEKMASLGVISAGIAHEINNPIAFILANIRRLDNYTATMGAVLNELIRRIPGDKLDKVLENVEGYQVNSRDLQFIVDDLSSLMEETYDGMERVTKIIADLKCFSHDRQDDFADLDVRRCLDISLNLAKHETRHKITIERLHDGPTCTIRGSETQLSQVFLNLIVNAAQAMTEGGSIRIHTTASENGYTIRISDTGPGIPQDVMESIFEPFFTTKPAGQGTGLGLAISQDIVRRHGGSIEVESSLGKGTTFTLALPVGQAASSHAA